MSGFRQYFKKQSVVAAFIVEDRRCHRFEVVVWGSGTKWESKITIDPKGLEKIPPSERGCVIWDYHAEVIARRILKFYLWEEKKKCANANTTSIFEYIDASGTRMRKRSDVFIHFYSSKVPCGGAAESLRDDNPCQLHSWGKMTKKPGTVPIDSNMVDGHGKKYLILKSCSDKISNWNEAGVQGSMLYPHIGKIFIDTIVISHSEECSPMRQNNVAKSLSSHAIIYVNNGLELEKVTSTTNPKKHRQKRNKISPEYISLNWCIGDKDPEFLHTKLNPYKEPVKDKCVSRICKRSLLHKAITEDPDVDKNKTYQDHKNVREYKSMKHGKGKYEIKMPHIVDSFLL